MHKAIKGKEEVAGGPEVHTAEDGQTSKQAIILAAEKFKVFAGGRSQILFNDSKAPQACTKTDRARPHTLPRWQLELEGFALKIFAQIVSLGNRSTGPSTSQSNIGRKTCIAMVADTSNYEGGPDLIHPLHYPAHGKFYHGNPQRN